MAAMFLVNKTIYLSNYLSIDETGCLCKSISFLKNFEKKALYFQ